MALNDVKIVSGAGPVRVYDVDDRDTSGATATIKAGEPLKVGGAGSNFVKLLATGDPELGVDTFVGIAAAESTETATADGKVNVTTIIPGKTILRCNVTTAANVDTAAKILGLKNDSITFDLTSGTFTIDEDEGTDPNVHGLIVVGGDTSGTLDVLVNGGVTEATRLVTQTMD